MYIAREIRNWTESAPCTGFKAMLPRRMSHEFCCQPLGDRMRRHLPLQWTTNCPITSCSSGNRSRTLRGNRIEICDLSYNMRLFHLSISLLDSWCSCDGLRAMKLCLFIEDRFRSEPSRRESDQHLVVIQGGGGRGRGAR
jgi:hypothetical protein